MPDESLILYTPFTTTPRYLPDIPAPLLVDMPGYFSTIQLMFMDHAAGIIRALLLSENVEKEMKFSSSTFHTGYIFLRVSFATVDNTV